jgi:dipeptide/tripeptide permease
MTIVWFFLALTIIDYFSMKVSTNYHFDPKAKRRFNTFFTLLILVNGAVSVISLYSAFMIYTYGNKVGHNLANAFVLVGLVLGIQAFLMRRGWNKIKNADNYFDITNDVYTYKKTLFSWSSKTKRVRLFPRKD